MRGYDSHLFSCDLNKFDVKISVIQNGLKKKIHGIFLNKKLVLIDSMQFMNSSLDKLVKHLADDDFEYLAQEFGCEYLRLLKQKVAYLIITYNNSNYKLT